MCILSYVPDEIGEISSDIEEGLWNGGINNGDGHGWAIADSDSDIMIMGKSLILGEAIEDFVKARKAHPHGPALFHSRWATHGSIKTANCHPFLVGNDHRTVLAHNGILPKDAHPGKDDDRSDTAILAEDLLPKRWFRLDKPTVQESLAKWCGGGNKLVILTVDPRYQEYSYLVNEKAGQWDDKTGMWHSNGDYKWPRKFSRHVSSWHDDDYAYGYGHGYSYPATIGARTYQSARSSADAAINATIDQVIDSVALPEMMVGETGVCDFCQSHVNGDNYCTSCTTCQDCYDPQDECLCYWQKNGVMLGITTS